MAYPTSVRFRGLDKISNKFWSFERSPYDEIIDNPERYLLTQSQLFDAEGGFTGLLIQLSTIGGIVGGLFATKPCLRRNFYGGHLYFQGWVVLAAAGFVGYRLGYWLGHTIAGDSSKVENHFAAFYWQKTQNRYDGRISLMKAPMTF